MFRKEKPTWITSEILELMNDRDTLFMYGYTRKSPELTKSAKALQTETKRSLRNAKAELITQ